MATDLDVQFERDMQEGAIEYRRKTGTRPSDYLQMIDRHGSVTTATRLAIDPHIQTGLQKAGEYDCIELTSEWLIMNGQYGAYQELFPKEVRLKAQGKLDKIYEIRDWHEKLRS